MNRRSFLQSTLATLAAPGVPVGAAPDPMITTVTGPIAAGDMGVALPHEHVMVDFIGADRVSPARYDADEVFKVALPHLKRVRELGCATLVECTPAYIGRDAALLKRLAEASGLNILTNTGYYNAGAGKYLPAHARDESADQLAARWTREWDDGIEGTAIKPGFIKIGVNSPLDEQDRKLIAAAARCHQRTGLAIAAHTGPARAAVEELDILEREGVDLAAWIWVHAQVERDMTQHVAAARRGAWVEFDGISPDSIDLHVKLVQNMKDHDLLNLTLISHDAGWYNVGQPHGGAFRPYDTLFTQFIPALRAAGFNAAELQLLTVANPAQALSIRL